MAEVTLPVKTALDGVPLTELQNALEFRCWCARVQRGRKSSSPPVTLSSKPGTISNISATHANMNTFFKKTGLYRNSVRSVLIVGGGRIAYYLASQLLRLGIRVKIVEHDENTCESLSDALPKAEILLGGWHRSGIADGRGHRLGGCLRGPDRCGRGKHYCVHVRLSAAGEKGDYQGQPAQPAGHYAQRGH